MEKYVKEYIISLLLLEQSKIKSMNLGITAQRDEKTKVELELIEKGIKLMKGLK